MHDITVFGGHATVYDGPVISLRFLLLSVLCFSLQADTGLEALRTTLQNIQAKASTPNAPRGATAEMTTAKHQLRDWVESRLRELTRDGDEGEFTRKLNAQLRVAKLLCGDNSADSQSFCSGDNLPGTLNQLKIHSAGVFLVLETAVGIECGFDESAYLYSWSDEGWRRTWQNEQNTYTEKDYKPQTLQAVLVSQYNNGNDYLVLTLGTESWCQSVWHRVYYRAFRLGPDPAAAPLVDGTEEAFVDDNPPIGGRVTRDDVLVEFATRSMDTGVHNRRAIRHYKISADGAKRIDPLALSPRDFVDEWLTHDWREAAFWSESAYRRNLLNHRAKLAKDPAFVDFDYPTMHCPSTPDIWQVGAHFPDPPIGAEKRTEYFLVRWRPPYQFTMVNVSDHPFPACKEEDRQADENRSLFPDHDPQ